MQNVLHIHDGDPNFPYVTLQKIKEFLGTPFTLAEAQMALANRFCPQTSQPWRTLPTIRKSTPA